MILYTLITTAIVLFCVHILFNYNERARLMRKIPGPQNVFIVGNMFSFLKHPVVLFNLSRKFANTWDELYRYWSFSIGSVNIYTPDNIEAIISTTKHNTKSILYRFLSPWLQDGLLLSDGQKWQHRRKILTPAFHFNILRKFCGTIEENSQRLVEALEGTAGQKVDVVPLLSEYTLNSICETAMGTRLSDEMSDAGKTYKAAIYQLGNLFIKRMTRLYLYLDPIFKLSSIGKKQTQSLKTVHDLTKKVIKERKEYVQKYDYEFYENTENVDDMYLNRNKKKTAMLDLLLLAQKDNLIDDVGIQEEVDTFMFEGHDTTAAGLTYCLMLLANHEDVQDRIFKELNEVFGNSDKLASIEDLSKLHYLERCIKESLRLYPPVPFIGRKLAESVTLSGYTVPSDLMCHIHIFDLHRRADLYPNPLKFDPDRFLPQNCAGRHPYAYIPFSAGPRNCIGQKFALLEMKSAVSSILRRFQLAPVTRPHDLKFIADLVLRNSEPVYVSFIRRT